MKRISESGFHLMLPMSYATLGDYGYFDGDTWRKLGNINSLRGYRCSLHRSILEYGSQDVFIAHEVELKILTQAGLTTDFGDAKCRLLFSKANGYYIQGKLHKLDVYDSIDFEVKKYLEKLNAAGIWKAEFRLVVGVVYASPCFIAFARTAGSSIDFSIDVNEEITPSTVSSDIKLSAEGVLNNNGVEIVDNPNPDKLYPIGFQVVKYSREWFCHRAIRYAGNGDIVNYTYQEDSRDRFTAVFE
ncbi:MAG: hypothetical protein K2I90_02035 [Odoribacter sp.]|nr:hypothetical protein [Odoribacter sp.]